MHQAGSTLDARLSLACRRWLTGEPARWSISRSKARVLGNRRLASILQLLKKPRRQFHRFGLRRIAMLVTMSDTEKREQLEHDPHVNVVMQERCPK
jgi:hypothetical protein